MIGFGIDEVQAEYVAEIKLRHLNREYILKRTEEIEELENAIADLEDILKRPARINKIIMKELADVAKKYGKPRRCEIMYEVPAVEGDEPEQQIPDYPRAPVLHAGRLLQEDHAPEPAHERRAEAQGRR